MQISPFKLERYFAQNEFKVRYLLSPSDCESLSLRELLDLANPGSLQRWETLGLGYTESPGDPALRQEVTQLYQAVTMDDILIAAPEELIFVFFNSLLHQGDRVVALAPAYQSLHEIAKAMGCQVQPWSLELEPDGWHLDLDKLEGYLKERTDLLVLNFPHNPTGYLPSHNEFQAMIQMARGRGIPVFCDEMYRLLEHDPGNRLPPVCDLYERGISLSGLSKTFALPGLRIGWLAAQDRQLINRCLAFKDYTTICNSAPSEILAAIALQAREAILSRNLAIIRSNLSTARQFCARLSGTFHWLDPVAGSIAFPRYTGPGSVEEFSQQALDQCGVMIVPGSLFDYPGSHFRLGLGRRNLPEALERLAGIL